MTGGQHCYKIKLNYVRYIACEYNLINHTLQTIYLELRIKYHTTEPWLLYLRGTLPGR